MEITSFLLRSTTSTVQLSRFEFLACRPSRGEPWLVSRGVEARSFEPGLRYDHRHVVRRVSTDVGCKGFLQWRTSRLDVDRSRTLSWISRSGRQITLSGGPNVRKKRRGIEGGERMPTPFGVSRPSTLPFDPKKKKYKSRDHPPALASSATKLRDSPSTPRINLLEHVLEAILLSRGRRRHSARERGDVNRRSSGLKHSRTFAACKDWGKHCPRIVLLVNVTGNLAQGRLESCSW